MGFFDGHANAGINVNEELNKAEQEMIALVEANFENPSVFNGACAYVDYAEDIYVGCRHYETRWLDNETNTCDEAAYRGAVQYPFGTGLSLTTLGNLTPSEQSAGSAAGRQALRTATHIILCTFANSNAQAISQAAFPSWTFLFVGLDVLALAAVVLVVLPGRKKQ